jgi:hypothetical protein
MLNDEVEKHLQKAKQALFTSTDPKYTAVRASREYDVPYRTL